MSDTDTDDDCVRPPSRSKVWRLKKKQRLRRHSSDSNSDEEAMLMGDGHEVQNPDPDPDPCDDNLAHAEEELPLQSHSSSPNPPIPVEDLTDSEPGHDPGSDSDWSRDLDGASNDETDRASNASSGGEGEQEEEEEGEDEDANDYVPHEDPSGSSEDESTSVFQIEPGSMNTVLNFSTPRTVKESLMLDLCMSVRHLWTYGSLLANFASKNVLFDNNYFPRSKKELWRLLVKKQAGIVAHVYCTCGNYIGRKKRLPQRVKCVCKAIVITSKAKTFFTISLKKQLQHFLQTPGIPELLQYGQSRRNEDPNIIEDFYDGLRYQELKKSMTPLDFTYVGNTDGCKTSKNASVSIYPFFLRINELPPNLRQKFIFIAGTYADTGEPQMASFLNPIVKKELNSLATEGVRWYKDGNKDNEVNVSRFFPHCICVDGKARYQILNMVSHASYYACPCCTFKGVPVGQTMRYPTRPHEDIPPSEERTHVKMVADMLKAFHEPNTSPVFGHKGLSPLAALKNFDLVTGVAFDDLHNLYECASKVHFDLLLKEAPRCRDAQNKELSGADLERTLDARLQQILTPSKISRKPTAMKVKNRKKCKGAEWRNLLLYYVVPCFQGLVVNSHIKHFEMLSEAAFIYSKDSLTEQDIDKAEKLIEKYLLIFDDYYGIEKTRFNLHGLLHAGQSVRNLGPLWSYSTFNFESWNNKLLSKISSPKSPLLQIIMRHQIQMYLELHSHSDPDLSDDVKEKCRAILKTSKSRVNAIKVEDHVHVLGPVKQRRRLTNSEEEVLLRENVDVQNVEEYEKLIISGVVYQTQSSKKSDALSDNSKVFTIDNTFCTIDNVITFRRNGGLECGLFVQEHSCQQPPPFTEAKHIAALCPDSFNIKHFIFPRTIRSPVVQIVVNEVVYVSPMPNLFEID